MSLDDARRKCEAWRETSQRDRQQSPDPADRRSAACGPLELAGKGPACRSKDGEQFKVKPSQASGGPRNQGKSAPPYSLQHYHVVFFRDRDGPLDLRSQTQRAGHVAVAITREGRTQWLSLLSISGKTQNN
jgi:hypothetical protein